MTEIKARRTRLEILEASLQKKEAKFDEKISAHFASVKEANGQPLNDKRGGQQTIDRWNRQSDSLRTLNQEIEKTKSAIEREKSIVSNVDAFRDSLPPFITEMVASGELIQWRKHPNSFFVPGVEKGRFVWDEKTRKVSHRYISDIPNDGQYRLFARTWNKLRAAMIKEQAQ